MILEIYQHIHGFNYIIDVNGNTTSRIALFNSNKLPTGVAIQCVETETYNPYLITMSMEQFQALVLDDADLVSIADTEESSESETDSNFIDTEESKVENESTN